MQRWEYRLFRTNKPQSAHDQLNAQGAQGWRVAAMTAVKGGVIFLLERPVVESGPDDDDQE